MQRNNRHDSGADFLLKLGSQTKVAGGRNFDLSLNTSLLLYTKKYDSESKTKEFYIKGGLFAKML